MLALTMIARAHNSDIVPYAIRDRGDQVLYLEDFLSFDDLPQMVRDHLKVHERELKSRAAFVRGDCEWWKYTWPLHKEMVKRPRLYCPYLAGTNRFAADTERRFLGLTDTTVLYDANQAEDLRYFVALLNSSLLTFRFRQIGKLKSSGIMEYFWNSISKLRVRRIDFQSQRDRAQHDALVGRAQETESAMERIQTARTDHDKRMLQREAYAAAREIDRLVFELYGLTQDEIGTVESSQQKV